MDSPQVQALRLAAMQARADGRRYAVVQVDPWSFRAVAADELAGTATVVATVGPAGWVDWNGESRGG